MITVFIRAIIVYVIVVLIYRLMGKRQVGEMEPYELVITLIIAEVACVPMEDKTIPLSAGIVPTLTLFIMHQLTILLTKNSKLQQLISGNPVIVIDKKGINYANLRSMNMNANDLLQAMRTAGYFTLDQINYALFETNGQLTVVPNPDMQIGSPDAAELPVPIILDGKWSEDELNDRVDRKIIENELRQHKLRPADVLLMTIDGAQHMVLQPRKGKYFTCDLDKTVVKIEKSHTE